MRRSVRAAGRDCGNDGVTGAGPAPCDVKLLAASLQAPPDAAKCENSAFCVPQNAQLFGKGRRVEENRSPSFSASRVLQPTVRFHVPVNEMNLGSFHLRVCPDAPIE